jgi:hypothetical protein
MTALRSKDYKVATNVLITDPVVIELAKEVAKFLKPETALNYEFMTRVLKEYKNRNGVNVDAANHHIGAVTEAIREINKW